MLIRFLASRSATRNFHLSPRRNFHITLDVSSSVGLLRKIPSSQGKGKRNHDESKPTISPGRLRREREKEELVEK
ncbi:hypothetical protein CEXT_32181 [Caerostris extrusa]|uniref:Uncharacterized protein n=1 Tax=Caerostris extrusa TaxID=172846 RepID=A0AAV4QYK5_CAEEX|nr:hypothetical protein CEXT_32181 [Caerostris extrusa]